MSISRYYLLCGQGEARVAAEMLAAPQYAPLHSSFSITASPRHCDLLLVTGAVNRRLRPVIFRLGRQIAVPGQVLAVNSAADAGLEANYSGVVSLNKVLPEVYPVNLNPASSQELVLALRSLSAPVVPALGLAQSQGSEGAGTLVALRPPEEREIATEDLTLSLGPVHPAVYGPLRLILTLDGEQVVAVEADPGYAHRGLEKAAEGKNFSFALRCGEALDGLAPLAGVMAVTQALEALFYPELERLPGRATYLRVVALELERIASHLFTTSHLLQVLALKGEAAQVLGLRVRVVEGLKAFTGSSLRGYILPGGVRNDPNKVALTELLDLVGFLKRWATEKLDPPSRKGWLNRYSFESRLKNIGILEAESALEGRVTGPNLRASGKSFDWRSIERGASSSGLQEAYRDLEFKPAYLREGDCLARFRLRLLEIGISAGLVKKALENLPAGARGFPLEELGQPGRLQLDPAQTGAEASGLVESPRGLLEARVVLSQMQGQSVIERLHFSSPSWAHFRLAPELLLNARLTDALVTLASLDIAPDEAER